MAGSVNKVIIIGNLGQDPEIRTTPSGAQVANFSVACTERWKDKDQNPQERTEWVRCVAWRQLADIVGKYVKKGDKIYLEGKLQTRSWDDPNGGGKKYATEVQVTEVTLLGNSNGGGQRQGGGQGGGSRGAAAGGDTGFEDFGPGAGVTPAGAADDDLPF